MCSWHGEVDPAIRRHGEPHIVRVGVDGALRPRCDVEVLLVSCGSNLSEEFDILVRAIVTISTIHSGMDEHLPCRGWDHTGDGEGDS